MSLATDARLGSELAGYRIERLLGRGGMSVVYLAEDLRLGRKVALKLLAPELSSDERFRERFLRESRLAASIDHPNVIPIYEAGEAEGLLYIAMRYVEGTDLKRLLEQEGRLEPARALAIVAGVANALDEAHAHGLVHRDVKPGNVLLGPHEHVYLSDFGLTKQTGSESGLTETGQFMGTADYVSPEQLERGSVDARSDLYALACVLYECLAGEAPYRSQSLMRVLWAHVNAPIPSPRERRPELPEGIDRVIARALAKNPDERFRNGRELVDETKRELGITSELVLPAPRRLARRTRVALALLVVALAAAALAVGLLLGGEESGEAKAPRTKPTVAIASDSLQRIDPESNRLAATIQVGSNPAGVAAGEGAVWVSNRDDNTLSKIDPGTNAVVATVPAVLRPEHIVVAEGFVWFSDSEALLHQVDSREGKIVGTLSVQDTGGVSFLAAGDEGIWGTVFCLCGDPNAPGSNRPGVTRITRPAGALYGPDIERIELPVAAHTGIAVGEGGVWTANDYTTVFDVTRIDPESKEVVAKIPLEGGATAIAAGEGAIWVANALDDTVSRIDPASNTVTQRIGVGDVPIAVAVGEGSVWVVNHDDGTVSRIDPATNEVVATIEVGPNPSEIAVGEGGVWVAVHAR